MIVTKLANALKLVDDLFKEHPEKTDVSFASNSTGEVLIRVKSMASREVLSEIRVTKPTAASEQKVEIWTRIDQINSSNKIEKIKEVLSASNRFSEIGQEK